MSLERVVVGVDFTEGSTAAARWVARELAPDAELVLVYVVDIPTPPAFLQGAFPPHDELVQTTIRGAEARLRELGGELRARLMWTKVRVGQPAEEIAAEAEEMHAGLIVVGEHGKRRGFWDVLGSTAERLVARSSVPVLVARGSPQQPPRRILAPVDESPVTAAVLELAWELAMRFNARVTALHALPSSLYDHPRAETLTGRLDLDELARSGARQWLEQELAAAGFGPGEADVLVTMGNVRDEIRTAAERLEADLIIMGSRGSTTGIERVILGSVASAVLRGANCPVLVVPPRTGES
ncbi:MAG TPA: universal stress protein [Longimicrobiales bacterium]|nr:universal stress protein [Longimicrobiales bacterium]